jgi:hypothetical protein
LTPLTEEAFSGTPYPRPGAHVVSTGNPPWLVVNHFLDRVIVRQWPVRPWRVGAIEAAPQELQVSDWYTRAISVEIVEEVPAWVLFGEHGSELAHVVDAAAHLNTERAAALAQNRAPEAAGGYADVWNRWQQERPTSGLQ